MSARWNLANKKDAAITYAQFLNLTMQLKELSDDAFAAPCAMTVTLMKRTKAESNFVSDFCMPLKEMNASDVTLETSRLQDVTEKIWDAAKFAEVTITPTGKKDATRVTMQFGGDLPQAATIVANGCDRDISASLKRSMLSANKDMLVGDGSATNTGFYSKPIFAANERELTRAVAESREPAPPTFFSFMARGFRFGS